MSRAPLARHAEHARDVAGVVCRMAVQAVAQDEDPPLRGAQLVERLANVVRAQALEDLLLRGAARGRRRTPPARRPRPPGSRATRAGARRAAARGSGPRGASSRPPARASRGRARAGRPAPARRAGRAGRGPTTWAGRRIVRALSANARWIDWRIHSVAYVENLKPLRQSNFSAARTSPIVPSCTRSENVRAPASSTPR